MHVPLTLVYFHKYARTVQKYFMEVLFIIEKKKWEEPSV